MIPNFDPDKWLQLGIAGALCFIVLITFILFIRALEKSNTRWSETVNGINTRWNETVDKIAERQDVTQRDTNNLMRGLGTIMARIEVKVDGREQIRKANAT